MSPSETEKNPAVTEDGDYLPGTHPDLPPPVFSRGPIGWIRANLFGSATDAALTLLAAYALYSVIPFLVDWMFVDAAFEGESRKDCRAVAEGACWAFIGNRLSLFIAAASGPMPRMPFSEWKMICRSGTMWLATLSGMPMPRFTVAPSGMAWATRHAI